MTKFAAIVLSLSVVAASFIPGTSAATKAAGKVAGDKSRPRYVENQVLIKFKQGAEPVVTGDFIDDRMLPLPKAKARAVGARDLVERAGLYVLELDASISVEEAVRQASADPRVEYAEPNYLYYTAETRPNDPNFSDMWGLFNPNCDDCNNPNPRADIGAVAAWDITTGSPDLVVGVIDSGADLAHPDLAPNAWVNPNEIAGNLIDDDRNGYVDDINGWNFADDENKVFNNASVDFHGTHVAGTIGAAGNNRIGVTGVAWNVKLMSLKFLGKKKGTGSTADAVAAIEYAIDQRRRGVNLRVLNASWGGEGESLALREAIAAAGEAGILVVCAAGNDSSDTDITPEFPTAWSKDLNTLISVAAINQTGMLADFSNFGRRTVDVAAPGYQILSLYPHDPERAPEGGYTVANGTSMATPHVSGVAVLVWSAEPGLTPAQVKRRIVSTSEPTVMLSSGISSAGQVNAYNALTNRVVAPRRPQVGAVEFKKKELIIDGIGFLAGSAVVEVNGVALSVTPVFDESYKIANGTLTRLVVPLGKKGMKKTFPRGFSGQLSVFNSSTGERSDQTAVTKF
ncbi:MAG TPA: S8 family peptidase [Blastocatellia bacterium]|nr:S8 family peptidase [Blastocatellia bacterium]